MKSLELQKNFLESKLRNKLCKIAKQRAELNRRETEAITTTVRANIYNQLLVGSLLEQLVQRIFKGEVNLESEVELKSESEQDVIAFLKLEHRLRLAKDTQSRSCPDGTDITVPELDQESTLVALTILLTELEPALTDKGKCQPEFNLQETMD